MVQVLQGNGRLRVFKPWDADAADHYSSESQILAAENSKKKVSERWDIIGMQSVAQPVEIG